MLHTAKPILLAGAVVLTAFVILQTPATSLSLATDAGYTDADACAAVQQWGPASVRRLESAGFPHATANPAEIYELQRSGTREAIVYIDWENDAAQCLSLNYPGTGHAVIDMTPRAYGVLVSEIKHTAEHGKPSGHVVGNLFTITFGTTVTVDGDASAGKQYKRALAWWATGLAGAQ